MKKLWPLWLLFGAMFLSWGAWGLVLNRVSPFSSPSIALPLFYGTGFFAILLTFLGFSGLLRIAFFPEKTLAHHLSAAFRQGFFVASAVATLAVFLQFRLLSLPILAMVLSFFGLLEAFFGGRR